MEHVSKQQYIPVMAHRLKDGIVEFDGTRDQEGRVIWLARHSGVCLIIDRVVGSKLLPLVGRVLDVVVWLRVSLRGVGRVDFQRGAVVKMPGDEAQSLARGSSRASANARSRASSGGGFRR